MLDFFGKLKVTPIIIPRKLEFDGDVMGGGFPDNVQSWRSDWPSMIATPILILPFLSLFSSVPWWKMICSLMVVVYFLSFHVSCRQYPLVPFVIIILTVFKLVVSWKTLFVLIYDSACTQEGIANISCSVSSLYKRARIVFQCYQFPRWRLMVLGRKTPIILLFHSNLFINWECLVPGCPTDYARAMFEMSLTRMVSIR